MGLRLSNSLEYMANIAGIFSIIQNVWYFLYDQQGVYFNKHVTEQRVVCLHRPCPRISFAPLQSRSLS